MLHPDSPYLLLSAPGGLDAGPTGTLYFDDLEAGSQLLGEDHARFTHDGDGVRVLSKVNGVYTAFVGEYFQWETGGITTTYYSAGMQKIAMRKDGEVYYLLGDHLGSSSVTVDDTGEKAGSQMYTPYGAVRASGQDLHTGYQYTGQFSYENDLGLQFYRARFYDSYLNHFISADTIVPQPGSPLGWDRYAYTSYNPMNRIDPTGHIDTTCLMNGCPEIPNVTVIFGGTDGSPDGVFRDGPDPRDPIQGLPAWTSHGEGAVRYSGPKANATIKNVWEYNDFNVSIIGYSAGGDIVVMWADPELRSSVAGAGSIVDVVAIGPTSSGTMPNGKSLSDEFPRIFDALLRAGVDIMMIDDDAYWGSETRGYSAPPNATGTFTFQDRNGIDDDGPLDYLYPDLPTWDHTNQVRTDPQIANYVYDFIGIEL